MKLHMIIVVTFILSSLVRTLLYTNFIEVSFLSKSFLIIIFNNLWKTCTIFLSSHHKLPLVLRLQDGALGDRSFFMREGGLVGFGKHHLKIA